MEPKSKLQIFGTTKKNPTIPQSHTPENPPTNKQVPFRGDHISHRHPTYSHRSPGRVQTRCTKFPGRSNALTLRFPNCIGFKALLLHFFPSLGDVRGQKRTQRHLCFLASKNDEAEVDVEKNQQKRQISPPKKKRNQKGARCILHSKPPIIATNKWTNGKQNLSAVPVALAQYFQLGHRPGVVHWLLQFYGFLWAWGYS